MAKIRGQGGFRKRGTTVGEVEKRREGRVVESNGSIFTFSDTYETYSKSKANYGKFSLRVSNIPERSSPLGICTS